MDSKILQYSLKLKKILRKLLVPSFQVKNDADFSILLTHLAGKENPGMFTVFKTIAYLLLVALFRLLAANIIFILMFINYT